MRLCRVRILTMRMGRQEIKGGACVCKNRFGVASSKIPTAAFSFHRKRSPVSLRLGHARALTTVQVVIHSPRAASLPPGRGLVLPFFLDTN